MPARIMRIADLQPTDVLRQESLAYLESLTNEEIKNSGTMQVWETSHGILLSDGNNRTAILAKRGERKVKVDYHNSRGMAEDSFIKVHAELAKKLRQRGIYSPMDLWQA